MNYNYEKELKKMLSKNKSLKKRAKELFEKRKTVTSSKEIGFDVIGYPEIGRPVLGEGSALKQFRYIRFVGLTKGVAKILSDEARHTLIYNMGIGFGEVFFKKLEKKDDWKSFLDYFAKTLKDFRIGIMSVSKWKKDKPIKIRLDECQTCAGMLDVNKCVCYYEAGIIAGVLTEFANYPKFLNKTIDTQETKCWGKGDTYCEFEAKDIGKAL